MTSRRLAAPYPAEVQADLEALGAVVGRIDATVAHLEGPDGLYEQRNNLLRRLLESGVPQAELARRCNRSSMAIALAVGKQPVAGSNGTS